MNFLDGRSAWRFGDIDLSRKEKAPQIADRIREAIAEGPWLQGQRLPSVGEIARRYGVAKSTVVVALRQVENDGLVRQADPVHLGYFVRGAQ
jgi:DNA-binding GntR family transcriptional regulator